MERLKVWLPRAHALRVQWQLGPQNPWRSDDSGRRRGHMDVVAWLLESDPAIRWQVLRDLSDAPEEDVAAERARIAGEGWGAQLLALQRPTGQRDGGIPTFKSTA